MVQCASLAKSTQAFKLLNTKIFYRILASNYIYFIILISSNVSICRIFYKKKIEWELFGVETLIFPPSTSSFVKAMVDKRLRWATRIFEGDLFALTVL